VFLLNLVIQQHGGLGKHELLKRKEHKTMTDYGKGSVLGAASLLPATSAAGVFLSGSTHPAIIVGFLTVSVLSIIYLVAHTSRYLRNRGS